jgi:hypothetical protein
MEELPSSKTVSVERESTNSEDRAQVETIEDQSPAEIAVDAAPGEVIEVPAKQAPHFKRRQTADRGR